MLKQLHIRNIILIESSEIPFEAGFNVLSGETGSGKSAIMNALNLISGERADATMVRKGADKGSVEAIFDIAHIPHLIQLLDESGIEHELDAELVIRREISAAGKSRAFINNQAAQLATLRTITHFLFDIVGQHANQRLLNVQTHREILDLFGNLQSEAATFAKSWSEENALRAELEALIRSEAQRLREIDLCQMELEELTSANLKEQEDEELFAEYTRLVNAEELLQKVHEITQALSGEKLSVLGLLSRNKHPFEQLVRLDSSLTSTLEAHNNAILELQEVAHTLRNYNSRIEHNPQRTAEVNERLSQIDRLKRRYGSTLAEIQAYQQEAQQKLNRLQNADEQIEELRTKLTKLESLNNKLAQQLTAQRRKTAKLLEEAVMTQLRALNMPKVQFRCALATQPRSQHGDDQIEFFMSPNVGEHQIPVRECASGGELSRLMLALQTLLAGRSLISTLVFDEIDANIGGETAAIVGEKLKSIGQQHQVLGITHFPQVAKHADHHLQISKTEQDGRTITLVKILNKKERQAELARMLGGGKREK